MTIVLSVRGREGRNEIRKNKDIGSHQSMQALGDTLRRLDDFINRRENHQEDLSKGLKCPNLWFSKDHADGCRVNGLD